MIPLYKQILYFLRDIFRHRALIAELARRDFEAQYRGSYLSFIWIFLQPLLLISILYFVFELGFRAGATVDVPFSLYLISGMVCWIYFSLNLSSGANAIKGYSFLVKKMDFRLSVLPIAKLLSNTVAHVFLVFIAIGLAWYQGYPPSWYTLQIMYYFFAMAALLLGINWLTSSTILFVKDVANIVAITVQFGFWLTPIFWNINLIPAQYQWLVKLNPVYYLVTGYRDSILSRSPFWLDSAGTIYFWCVCLFFLLIGILIYRRLRPHFAEVI